MLHRWSYVAPYDQSRGGQEKGAEAWCRSGSSAQAQNKTKQSSVASIPDLWQPFIAVLTLYYAAAAVLHPQSCWCELSAICFLKLSWYWFKRKKHFLNSSWFKIISSRSTITFTRTSSTHRAKTAAQWSPYFRNQGCYTDFYWLGAGVCFHCFLSQCCEAANPQRSVLTPAAALELHFSQLFLLLVFLLSAATVTVGYDVALCFLSFHLSVISALISACRRSRGAAWERAEAACRRMNKQ